METQSLIGTRFPCPRDGNGIADPMKTQTLSLTPRFSEVQQLSQGTSTVLAVCPTGAAAINPFFKAFQRLSKKNFHQPSPTIKSSQTQSNLVKPSQTKSNHTPSPYESPSE
jgi:hypothetical protein